MNPPRSPIGGLTRSPGKWRSACVLAFAFLAACGSPTTPPPSRQVEVVLRGEAAIAETDPRFLSFAIDTALRPAATLRFPPGCLRSRHRGACCRSPLSRAPPPDALQLSYRLQRQPVQTAKPGEEAGIKLDNKVRQKDKVYKVTA